MQLAKQLEKLGTETAFTVAASAAQWAKKGNKVYPFHLGDINLATPENIAEAAFKAIHEGHTGYCPGNGIDILRDAIAQDVGSKRQLNYSAEQVSIQPGGKPVIGKFIMATMNAGDEVLYPVPGYPIYESQIEYHGGIAVPYSYIETASGFSLDLAAMEDSITDKTRLLIYNNFQNPNGAQSSREEMEAIADLAIKHDLWVLSDDAYFEIQYGNPPLSIANIPGMQERTVILYTCSKRFAMTGWRIGAAIGPQAVINAINRMNINAESCTSQFIQYAALEAITGDNAGPTHILNTLRERRNAATAGLNAIEGISITAPNSTFYLYPNVTEIMARKGLNNVAALMTQALHQSNVSFCTSNHFGKPIKNTANHYIRFAYSGIDVANINEGMKKLKIYFEA